MLQSDFSNRAKGQTERGTHMDQGTDTGRKIYDNYL